MKQKFIELLAFDENQDIQYREKCQIKIDRRLSKLYVEPKNKEFEIISASLKWDFFIEKNILFVFAEDGKKDFALVFEGESRCKKVYDLICADKAENCLKEKMLLEKIFIPFCKQISLNENSESAQLKRIFIQWINFHDKEEKVKYTKLLKEHNVFDLIFISKNNGNLRLTSNNKEGGSHGDHILRERKLRKRRFHQTENAAKRGENDQLDTLEASTNFDKVVPASHFKFVNIKQQSRLRPRLLVFTNPEKSHLFEYTWNPKKKLFYCTECRRKKKAIAAIYDKDENGQDCVKMEEHVCIEVPYIPEKFVENKIFKKPEYKILENCNTTFGKLLVIFDKSDKNQCFEFRAMKETYLFQCRQCCAVAKIWNEDSEIEFIELINVNHQCKTVLYEPKKYYEFKNFVLAPNFEFRSFLRNGEEKKRLIIFDNNDRSLCYMYHYNAQKSYCLGCYSKRLIVSAKLFTNSEGEEYVLLSNTKHVCEMRPYSHPSINELIIRPPNCELMENTKDGIKRLFIFDSNNRKLCYVYSCHTRNKYSYLCVGCISSKKRGEKNKKIVIAKLCKDNKTDEYYVQLNNVKHACKPRKYEPEKYEKQEIPKCYDYFYFRQKRFSNSINVAIRHPKKKDICFQFNYDKIHSKFRCCKCQNKKSFYSIKIEKNENGEECFKHDHKRHVCEPTKVSSISPPEFVILERSELKFTEKLENQKIDESRIIRLPNFELRSNEKGIPERLVFIFNSGDRETGYLYRSPCSGDACLYKCKGRFCHVTGRIKIQENGEKYFILSYTRHKCEPQKYEDICVEEQKAIIDSSDFITISKNNKITNIIVFTTPTRDECYEFGWITRKNCYRCAECQKNNKNVIVKLCKDENGKEFLEMSKQDHICNPTKYIKEKYEPKIVSINNFVFHSDSSGIENDKYLIIFTSEKKDLCYQYLKQRPEYYKCLGCDAKRIHVSAKVIEAEKNGILTLRFGETEHGCETRKYDPKKYHQEYICQELFQLYPNRKSDPDKTLLIFTSAKKEFMYVFIKHKNAESFYCSGCNNKKHSVIAKIVQNENGCKVVKLNQIEHICNPKKFVKEVYEPKIIAKDLFELHPNSNGESNKKLIIFSSAKKDYAFEYSWNKFNSNFVCNECRKKNVQISAKLIQNENDNMILKLGIKEHVCKPRKIDLKKCRS